MVYDPSKVTAEQQLANPRSVAVSAADVELAPDRQNKNRRVMISITPITAGVTVTVTYGDGAAVMNAGQVLQPNQTMVASSDAGSSCWQGAIHAIASGAGSCAVLEQFEETF